MNGKYKIISDRIQAEWIVSCPLQIKRVVISLKEGENLPQLSFTACTCGDFEIISYNATAEIISDRREVIGKLTLDNLTSSEIGEIPMSENRATFAKIIIDEVKYRSRDGEMHWKNENSGVSRLGIKLNEQEIFWQNDELYEQIKRECVGVVDAKYRPDEVNGGWRCACGQVNLSSSEKCGSCGVTKSWLREHLDEDYLKRRKAEDDVKSEKEIKREIKTRRNGISDRTKALLILSAFASIVACVVLTFTLFIPMIKYSSAERAVEAGEFDKAIEIFSDLGNFRDAPEKMYDASYSKAQYMTGIDDVYVTTSSKEPWFKIDDSGVLSFKKDDYTGSWDSFVIPDVVDGKIVCELERNFFLNCDELSSVYISDCVEIIGEQCFFNCTSLTDVYFGKNVSEIRARAFINCSSLLRLEIPDTVTTLGIRVFNNCTSLKNVIFGNGITKIGSYLFSMCEALGRITLGSPITAVEEFAFYECHSLEKIYCRFSENDWSEPTVGEGNEAWLNAEISFGN